MLINPIQQNFGCSRISVSKVFTRDFKKAVKASSELKEIAKRNDIYFDFSKINLSQSYNMMTVFKRGIDHVADIPEFAIKNYIGDSIYIPWEKVVYKREIPENVEKIIYIVKKYFNNI